MTIHFGILHSVHRKQQTLLECIAALHAAGAQSIMVFPDNGAQGPIGNWSRAITALYDMSELGDLLCVLDEDFILHNEALVKLEALDNADWFNEGNAATLITMEQNIDHSLRAAVGWADEPFGYNTWGGGIVMAPGTALRLRTHPYFVRYLTGHTDGGKLIDAVPFETLRLMGARLKQHLPSLADHIGTDGSLLGNNHENGLTRGFRFEEWSKTE